MMNPLEEWREDYEDQLVTISGYYTRRIPLRDYLEIIQSQLQEKHRAPGRRASQ